MVMSQGGNVWKRAVSVLLVVAMFLGGAAALGPDPAYAQTGTYEVRLARLAPSSLLWLHAIANDRGIYERYGLRVIDMQVQSSAALVQAVASGSADAGIALGDNVIQAIDQGAPVIITGAILRKPVLRLIGTVDTIPELRGKRVTAGAVQGGTTDLLRYMLMRAGVDPRSTLVVALTNSSDRVVALQQGHLAGALLIPPYDTLALRGGAKLLDVYDGYWLQTPLIVNTNWARSNLEAARRLTQALAEAAAWIYDSANREAAIDILARYTGVEHDIAAEGYVFMIEEIQAISPDLSVPSESIESIFQIRQALYGEPMPQFDLYKYYDPTYLKGN